MAEEKKNNFTEETMGEQVKEELYLASLKRMAKMNARSEVNSLTKMHNLPAFLFLCGEMIKSNPDYTYGLIVMDITQFKAANEFCGRVEGDKMLLFIADILRNYETNRPHTIASHIRADNFCICTAYDDQRELSDIADDIREAVREYPFQYRIHMNFGICASTERMPAVSYLKDCATMALGTIKGKFFANYAFFDASMRLKMLRERQIENDISRAVENGEIIAYIQPKVNMKEDRIVGGEALVRWIKADGTIVSPGDFIPVLERNGFIINIDKLIWNQIFDFLMHLQMTGRPMVPISINVSRVHIYDDDLVETLTGLRYKYHVPGDFVPLELTESAFLEDEGSIYEVMDDLRTKGFKIHMDDFGTGYSSMDMLRSQPMDEIKMDRTFIMDVKNKRSRIILDNMVQMLQELGDHVIVEGVEDRDQKDLLLELGVEKAQGFLFYRPMPIKKFDELLRAQEKRDRDEANRRLVESLTE